MSEDAVYKVIKMLGAAYGKDNIEPETIVLYVRMLADIDDHVLEQSCLEHISKSQWFPKISELRKSAACMSLSARLIPSAYQAWEELNAGIVRYGHSNEPEWSHPIVQQTVQSLGYYNLCMSTNQVADRARFIEAYGDYKDRFIDDEVTLPEIKMLASKMTKKIEAEV